MEGSKLKNKHKRQGVSKQTAFVEYKQSEEGCALEVSIRDNRAEMKMGKDKVRGLTEKCNSSKKLIDACKVELDRKQDERKTSLQNQLNAVDDEDVLDDDDGPQEIIDEDELALLQRMKELKKSYRATYQELKAAKSVVHQIVQGIDQAK